MNNLQNVVLEQLGYNEDDLDQTSVEYDELRGTLSDITNHSIIGGFSGFTYHTETVAFAAANKAEILQLARDQAAGCGFDGAYSLIATFGCLGKGYTTDSVADAVNNPEHEDYVQVMNALAWFAAEEVARELIDNDQ